MAPRSSIPGVRSQADSLRQHVYGIPVAGIAVAVARGVVMEFMTLARAVHHTIMVQRDQIFSGFQPKGAEIHGGAWRAAIVVRVGDNPPFATISK